MVISWCGGQRVSIDGKIRFFVAFNVLIHWRLMWSLLYKGSIPVFLFWAELKTVKNLQIGKTFNLTFLLNLSSFEY